MHIVYVTNGRIPSRTANSLQSMKVCAGFVSAGHEVTMIVPRFTRALPTPAELRQQYGVPVNFRIEWLRGYRTLGRVAWEARAAMHALRRRGDLHFTINMRIAAALASLGHPTVLELHDPPARRLDERALRMLPGRRGLRAFVCVSNALRRIMTDTIPGFGECRVVVEPNGVDLERFRDAPTPMQARRRLGWDDAALTVGYAGHLYEGRGFDMILALAAQYPADSFRVMGGEPAAVDAARSAVAERGLSNVDVLGFVPNAELPLYLHACDVLLMPYARQVRASGGGETAAFANPMKMFEYMAAGRLIISSRLPGIEEVLDGSNALLCEPDDQAEWSAALNRAHDAELRSRLGRKAHEDVLPYATDLRARRILDAAGLPTDTGW
jgi:glycosyltransferase involved in cell wall biosynthesis